MILLKIMLIKFIMIKRTKQQAPHIRMILLRINFTEEQISYHLSYAILIAQNVMYIVVQIIISNVLLVLKNIPMII